MSKKEWDDLGNQWDNRALRRASDATVHPWRWVLGGFVAFLVAITIIVVGGWQIGWWFKEANVNRTGHLYRHSYGFQQNLRDDITKNIGNALGIQVQIAQSGSDPSEQAVLRAQGKAVVAIVCDDASQVSGDSLPASQARFVNANCQAGNISPSSPFQKGTNP